MLPALSNAEVTTIHLKEPQLLLGILLFACEMRFHSPPRPTYFKQEEWQHLVSPLSQALSLSAFLCSLLGTYLRLWTGVLKAGTNRGDREGET